MFLSYYGLREQPFGVTPDPRFLYLSPAHREALASMVYGIEAGRGFIGLIAPPGMGKTTLLFHLLEKFRSSARTAFLFQTQCNSREFMRFLLAELGYECDDHDFVHMHEEFNKRLLQEARAGNRFIVVIDEAQNLEPSVLETVRLLSDFETPRAKLMQIILAGQPELADKLARPGMIQLRQRVSLMIGLEAALLRRNQQVYSAPLARGRLSGRSDVHPGGSAAGVGLYLRVSHATSTTSASTACRWVVPCRSKSSIAKSWTKSSAISISRSTLRKPRMLRRGWDAHPPRLARTSVETATRASRF